MKLQHIVAAVALVASSTAFARVEVPASTSLGGEMSLTVYSVSTQASVLIDTGIMLADFRAMFTPTGGAYTLNLANNTAFNDFLALAGNATDIRYTFFGGDNSGVSANQRTMIATVSGNPANVTNGNMVDSMNVINTSYLAVANLKPAINPSMGGDVNGSLLAIKGQDGNAYFMEALNPTFRGNFVDTSAAIGTQVAIYDFVRSSTSSGIGATESFLGGGVNQSFAKLGQNSAGQYVFSVTAVPEPSTYALAIAGLAVAGIAARRRRAA